MVRRRKIHISLYLIIPTIFSGLSFIAVIVAYRITSRYLQMGIVPDGQIILLGMAIAVFTFFCGFLIIRLVLQPVIQFVKTAEKLPAISQRREVVDYFGRPESI